MVYVADMRVRVHLLRVLMFVRMRFGAIDPGVVRVLVVVVMDVDVLVGEDGVDMAVLVALPEHQCKTAGHGRPCDHLCCRQPLGQ